METKSAEKLAVQLTAFHYAYRAFVWTTTTLGLGYLTWLGWSGVLLEPVAVDGSTVKLDLLQTLAFFIAVTALEGTAVATAFNRMFVLLVPSHYEDIQRVELALGRRRSLLQKVAALGIWLWCPAQAALAIMTLCQGFMEVSLSESSSGTTSLVIDGWLAAACAGSWVLLVLVVSSLAVGFYASLRHQLAALSIAREHARGSRGS